MVKSIWSTRNLRYLRITHSQVMPLVLYLKQEHVIWFTDLIYNQIIASLKSIILNKLISTPKKPQKVSPTADVFRSSTASFQFAYYFRHTPIRHSVVHGDESYIQLENENEEEKPILHVSYTGFTTYPKTLMLAVEPYDPTSKTDKPTFLGFEIEKTTRLTNFFDRLESDGSSSTASNARAGPSGNKTDSSRKKRPLVTDKDEEDIDAELNN